ncbi:MAG: DUF3344 domain-containing protein [Myxococcaceae bacterium]|nr:DUF3344 domain-containing protein [Myxococcaceae bacterium]
MLSPVRPRFASLALGLVLVCVGSSRAAPVLRHQVDQRGDFVLIGNTLSQDCASSILAPLEGTVGSCGNRTGDSSGDAFWTTDGTTAQADVSVGRGNASSQAMLSLPAGAVVTYARLYWAGTRKTSELNAGTTPDTDAVLGRAGTFSASVTADVSHGLSASNDYVYESSADVTELVLQHGPGAYRVSGVDTVEFRNLDHESVIAGWALVVFYRLDGVPLRNLTLFDGLDGVRDGVPANASLSGFLVPVAGYSAKLGVVAYEGDHAWSGDALVFNGTALTDSANPGNNFFNGSRSTLGSAVSLAGDLPRTTGGAASLTGLDLDVVDITARVSGGQTSATFSATSSRDIYYLGAFVTSISTQRPDFTHTRKTVRNLTRTNGTFLGGDVLEYTVTTTNGGDDTGIDVVMTDPLSPLVDYVPGSLQVSAGPNSGAKTDDSGDDQGEYVTGAHTLQVRLGTGADAVQGGTLAPGEGSTVVFQVRVKVEAVGFLDNQALVEAAGLLGTPPVTTGSSPDGGPAGPTRLVVTEPDTGGGPTDSDGDGVDDDTEIGLGLDPTDNDTDDDGVADGQDGLDDTDGDWRIDALDEDSDDDGLTDGLERGVTADTAPTGTDQGSPHFQPDVDPSTTTDPKDADTDGDTRVDGVEDRNHNGRVDDGETDPNRPDTDTDGLTDGTETLVDSLTDPLVADTDSDGVMDGVEDANRNGDVDVGETDPHLADTDRGGVSDGEELHDGSNPLDGNDDLAVVGAGCGAAGGGPSLFALLSVLGLAFLSRGRRAARSAAAGGLLVALLVPWAARAQELNGSSAIDVQQFKPGPGARDILAVQTPRVAEHLAWNVGLYVHYAQEPLRLTRPSDGSTVNRVVEGAATADLLGSVGLFGRLELGVALPVSLLTSEPAVGVDPAFPQGGTRVGVGDVRLVPKVELLRNASGFDLGVAVPVVLPSGGASDFAGAQGVGVQPRLLGEWANDSLRLAVALGANLRSAQALRSLTVGHELAYALGAEVPFRLGTQRLAAQGTFVGALGLEDTGADARPMEALLGLQYVVRDGLVVRAGGGPGIGQGYGTPTWRAFVGLCFTDPGMVVRSR